MNLRFDHAVVVVSSLVEATREFTEAGFTVIPGGRHDALPTEIARHRHVRAGRPTERGESISHGPPPPSHASVSS